jgi:hypothetical protein
MTKLKMVVLTSPVAGQEDEFNEWYTNIHLKDVVAVPGILSAQRFKLSDPMGFEHRHQYLAIYEIESDDPQGVVEELLRRRGSSSMMISDALNMETAVGGVFEPCSPVVSSGSSTAAMRVTASVAHD